MARSRTRSGATVLAALLLIAATLLPVTPASAADPAAEARLELTRRHGGRPADFSLVSEQPATAVGGLWAGKFLDARTGDIHSTYRRADGAVGTSALLDEAVAAKVAALPLLERKADRPLVQAVRAAKLDAPLRVAVWLDVDVTEAEAAVVTRHPEVEWIAGRPVPTSLDQARALRAELWEARQSVYASAAATVEAEVAALGGSVQYASTSAPLVFVDLPPDGVEPLAARPEVLSLGLEQTWETFMSSAGPAVAADWTSGSADQGNGVRVAVIEYHNAANTGDLAGQVPVRRSTTGRVVTGIHPTWVAGAIASRSGTWRGVAPGADIVSSSTGGYSPSLSTDRAIIAATDWAVSPSGGDADIVNASLGQDTATGAEEARRYFDSVGWEDNRLVVASSGNYSTFRHWDVVSPGTGYNVLTVGGTNDRGTAGVGDDILWHGSNGANYRDRTDAPWNPHGDYNKPNLSAPAVSVRTANGSIGDGTSISSPIVAGIGAQLLARAPSLMAWPEASRAVLMAGAYRRTPLSNGTYSRDHEGVGSASARWSNRVLDNGLWGGYTFGAMSLGQTVTRSFQVVRGQTVRVALAWSSHTTGTSNTGKTDILRSDLDLVVRQPNGGTVGSYSFDNSYEAVTLVASATGTMTVAVRHDRFDTDLEPYGLAWLLTSPYSDAGGSAFYGDILWAAHAGLTYGCGGGRFCPTQAVTRGEMAAFLTRALDLPAASRDAFIDDEGNAFESSINAVAAAGIASGCAAGRFCPTRSVTRAEMASFLVRAFDVAPSSRDHFSDDEASTHEAAINALASAGLAGGCSPVRYCPRSAVTREQMTAFLHRAVER